MYYNIYIYINIYNDFAVAIVDWTDVKNIHFPTTKTDKQQIIWNQDIVQYIKKKLKEKRAKSQHIDMNIKHLKGMQREKQFTGLSKLSKHKSGSFG